MHGKADGDRVVCANKFQSRASSPDKKWVMSPVWADLRTTLDVTKQFVLPLESSRLDCLSGKFIDVVNSFA